MSFAAGATLGPYQLERLIGSGGFSIVWQARDHRFDSTVALKILAENHALNVDARTRFVDEARMIRKVGSDHIVAVHDIGETPDGQPFLVLAVADRGDLSRRLVERSPGGAGPADAAHIVSFLTDALGDVHAAGLVHRDVKPGNVLIARRVRAATSSCRLLDDDERLLLADLGFAKDLDLASGYTSGGGTRWFQAPEQLPAVARVDHRADIYAASALVAWLLTGSVPNPASNWAEHLGERGINHGLTPGLAEKPEDRPDSMATWGALVHVGLSTAVPVRRGISRRSLLAGSASLVAVAGGTAAGWLVGRSGEANTDIVVDDDTVRIRRTTTLGTVQVVGPKAMVVGEPAVFRATGPADVALSWVPPDGGELDAAQPLELVASSPGIAVVNLQAIVEGRLVVISHDVAVTDRN